MSNEAEPDDERDMGVLELAAHKAKRFRLRVDHAFAEPASPESQGIVAKDEWETADQLKQHAWPEFKRVIGTMMAGLSAGALVGMVNSVIDANRVGEQVVLDQGQKMDTESGLALYHKTRNQFILKSSFNSALKYSLVIGLFSSIQMSLGVKRGVHDVYNTMAAATLTGSTVGLTTQRGRGLLWGAAYGVALGAVCSVAEISIRMVNDEDSLLPRKDAKKPTQDFAAAIRADLETDLELSKDSHILPPQTLPATAAAANNANTEPNGDGFATKTPNEVTAESTAEPKGSKESKKSKKN